MLYFKGVNFDQLGAKVLPKSAAILSLEQGSQQQDNVATLKWIFYV